MGNISFANRLSAAERQAVDQLLRERQFYGIDDAVTLLQDQGIQVTRSALGRYMKAQRERLTGMPDGSPPTVVTVVDRVTGAARILHSELSLEEIEALIAPKN
jgi:hypothetical protein